MTPKKFILVATGIAAAGAALATEPIQPAPTVTTLDYIERLCSGFPFKDGAVDSQTMSEPERSRLMVSIVCEISKATVRQMPPMALDQAQN